MTKRMIVMPLPAEIWSTNKDRNLHHYERARLIGLWKEATMVHYRKAYGMANQPPSIIQIGIPVKTKGRRDPHNYCGTVLKAVIDGLVKAGAWPDDTPEYIGHREPEFLYRAKDVVIEWSPIERMGT